MDLTSFRFPDRQLALLSINLLNKVNEFYIKDRSDRVEGRRVKNVDCYHGVRYTVVTVRDRDRADRRSEPNLLKTT